jgi:hypothetical protein
VWFAFVAAAFYAGDSFAAFSAAAFWDRQSPDWRFELRLFSHPHPPTPNSGGMARWYAKDACLEFAVFVPQPYDLRNVRRSAGLSG